MPVQDPSMMREYDAVIQIAFNAVAASTGTASLAVSAGRRRRLAAAQATHSIARPRRRAPKVGAAPGDARAGAARELAEARVAVAELEVQPLHQEEADGGTSPLPTPTASDPDAQGFRRWLQTWPSQRAAIGRYYLATVAVAERRIVLRQAYRHILAAVRMAASKAGGLIRVQPVVEAVFAKLSFNQGQGLWNTFDIAQDNQAGLLTLLQLPRFACTDEALVSAIVTVAKQGLLRAYYDYMHPTTTPAVASLQNSPAKVLPIRTFCLLEAATPSPPRRPRRPRRQLQELALATPYARATSLHRQVLPTPAELVSAIL